MVIYTFTENEALYQIVNFMFPEVGVSILERGQNAHKNTVTLCLDESLYLMLQECLRNNLQ